MIVDTSSHNIDLPFSPGDEVCTFEFTSSSVSVVVFTVDSICIADAGDAVCHIRMYLRSGQHWIRSQDVDVLGWNDILIVTSHGVYFFNEGNLQQKIVAYKTADFTIPA